MNNFIFLLGQEEVIYAYRGVGDLKKCKGELFHVMC